MLKLRETGHFQTRLYLACYLLISLPLIFVSLFFYHYNFRVMRNNLNQSTTNNLDLVDTQISGLLTDMDSSLKRIQLSRDFRSLVDPIPDAEENYFSLNPFVSQKIGSVFQAEFVAKPYRSSLYYISRYDDYFGLSYNTSARFIQKKQLRSDTELNALLNMDAFSAYLPPHTDRLGQKENSVFSVVRPVRDLFTTYGLLEYSIESPQLGELLSAFADSGEYHLLLLDRNGTLCYAADSLDYAADVRDAYLRHRAEASKIFSYDKNRLCAFKTSALTGWTIILVHDISKFSRQMQTLAFVTFLSFLAIMGITALFLYGITSYLTRPLRNLCRQLQNYELAPDQKISLDSGNNEIAALAAAVKQILGQIYLQNYQLQEARKRTFQAHYKTLEAQLNSHFLYNTLSVIGATGLSEGNVTIANMCSELASLLRYSISYSGKPVELKDEFENIRSYLYIMQVRYENGLEIRWDLDPALDRVRVPKLILQPLVENCFQHGFKSVAPPWKIEIRSFRSEDGWHVQIINNGAKFSEEKKNELYEHYRLFSEAFLSGSDIEGHSGENGFGLENTIFRMHIYFKGKDFFRIAAENGLTILEIGGRAQDEENNHSDC